MEEEQLPYESLTGFGPDLRDILIPENLQLFLYQAVEVDPPMPPPLKRSRELAIREVVQNEPSSLKHAKLNDYDSDEASSEEINSDDSWGYDSESDTDYVVKASVHSEDSTPEASPDFVPTVEKADLALDAQADHLGITTRSLLELDSESETSDTDDVLAPVQGISSCYIDLCSESDFIDLTA